MTGPANRGKEGPAVIVLSRRKNEAVVIDNAITVRVVEVRGDKVRLAVTAPAGVAVHRQEVFEAVFGRPRPPEPRPPEEEAFLRAVAADPGDEATRLVFADWLQERGDPLGEFLRLQCEREELDKRARALWAEHGAAWQAYLPPALWLRGL
jgi:carbon storage regulator